MQNRIPSILKYAYTAFMAILVPVYLYYYGPTDLTDILDQRDRDYCITALRSRWNVSGADVRGAGGR